ncbi:MAG: DUF2235 domain-containing protein [Chloroflexi bacterium]|nr:DUF2235 domain-containing protein [Chloroflexota bacterium]
MRRLIVCSDGTWNTPEPRPSGMPRPSNVVQLARALLPVNAHGEPQIVFYDPGVGTGNFVDRWTGGAVGAGLDDNVKDAYRFLVHNYAPGDGIYFFGFSRGAYTVRSAAGLIRKCGILRRTDAGLLDDAFRIYRKLDPTPDTPEAIKFRADHSIDPVPIRCIGVWDTVGALGIPMNLPLRFLSRRNHQFHDVRLSSRVAFAFQALAIDEHRKVFEPTIWEQSETAGDQVFEQAWFPGGHCDVGGGHKDAGLSDGALRWMVQMACTAGLEFDESCLATLHPDACAAIHDVRGFPYLRRAFRPIGLARRANETLHPTALERHDRRPDYRPRNLEDHLARERMALPGNLVASTPDQ